MNDPIGLGGAALEAVETLKRPVENLGASGSQSRRLLVRASEAEHVMASRNQVLDNGRMKPVAPVTNTRIRIVSRVSLETNVR